jgi:hypothetical protein
MDMVMPARVLLSEGSERMPETRDRNFPPRLALRLAAVIAAAAVTLGPGPRDAQAQGTAAVLVSTAADRTCAVPTLINLRSDGQFFQLLKGMAPVNRLMQKSDFPNYFGNVCVLRVEPGDYYFAVEAGSQTRSFRDGRLSRIRLAAGDVKYVGDVSV